MAYLCIIALNHIGNRQLCQSFLFKIAAKLRWSCSKKRASCARLVVPRAAWLIRFPIFDCQIGHAAKFARVVRDQRGAIRQRNRRNQQIIGANRRALLVKLGA